MYFFDYLWHLNETALCCVWQDAQDIARARQADLPPLQSVLELTTAFKPPQRGEEPVSAQAAPSIAGVPRKHQYNLLSGKFSGV
jgi:hypothetical protein